MFSTCKEDAAGVYMHYTKQKSQEEKNGTILLLFIWISDKQKKKKTSPFIQYDRFH